MERRAAAAGLPSSRQQSHAAAFALCWGDRRGWRAEEAVKVLLDLVGRNPDPFSAPFEALAHLGSEGCGKLVVDAVVQRIRGAAGDSERCDWFEVLGEIGNN